MMRIITGSARGTKLYSLEGTETRPTSERTKEALFSMLQFEIEGRRVLDLFAGSGQLGLEALSRGAVSAFFVDLSREAMDIVKSNAEKTHLSDKCKYLVSDWKNYIRKAKGREAFDIVFIDPPYGLHAGAAAAERLLDAGLLSKTAVIAVESEEADIFEQMPEVAKKFTVKKKTNYGKANLTLITPVQDMQSGEQTH